MGKSFAPLLILIFLTACIIAVKPASSSADVAENSWVSKAPLQQARSFLDLAVVNGKIYAIGGNTLEKSAQHTTGGVVGTNEEYDPATDTWTFKAWMPTPREAFAIAVCQNKIYCIGGSTSSGVTGVNEVYDPATDTWEIKASLPNPRYGIKANVVGGKIYLIGGYVGDASSGYSHLTLNDVYDPEMDSWSTKAPMPTVSGLLSAVVNDKIYVLRPNLNQIYDTKTDSWSLEGTPPPYLMLYARAGATTGVNALKRIYIIGDSGTLVYDPINDKWTNGATIPTDREGFSVAVVNDILYAIGGYTATYPDILSLSTTGPSVTLEATNEQYTPFGYGTPDPSYDGTAPEIAVVSPENKTYYTGNAGLNFTDVALNFTADEPVFSVHYELDGETFEISGNTTLVGLAIGVHNVTVSAFDAAGNMGASETVSFSVAEEPEPEPFPTVLVATASGASVAIIAVGLLVYFRRRKR
jgi:N-acetylneuraminic acid mutarotase